MATLTALLVLLLPATIAGQDGDEKAFSAAASMVRFRPRRRRT